MDTPYWFREVMRVTDEARALLRSKPTQAPSPDPIIAGLDKTVYLLKNEKFDLEEKVKRLQAEAEKMRRAGIRLKSKVESLTKDARAAFNERQAKRGYEGDSLLTNLCIDLDGACGTAGADMDLWVRHRVITGRPAEDGSERFIINRVEFNSEGAEVVTFVAQCSTQADAERLVGLLDGWGR